jgi:hypothetical protein
LLVQRLQLLLVEFDRLFDRPAGGAVAGDPQAILFLNQAVAELLPPGAKRFEFLLMFRGLFTRMRLHQRSEPS